jgi:hypothetical protein
MCVVVKSAVVTLVVQSKSNLLSEGRVKYILEGAGKMALDTDWLSRGGSAVSILHPLHSINKPSIVACYCANNILVFPVRK